MSQKALMNMGKRTFFRLSSTTARPAAASAAAAAAGVASPAATTTQHVKRSYSTSDSNTNWWTTAAAAAAAAAAVAAAVGGTTFASSARCDGANTTASPDGKPYFRKSEIAQHNSKDKGVWVTYGTGVYDITTFIVNHPGGQDKILLAAGQAVEPYWSIYRQHYNSKLPGTIMPGLLIGYIHPDDVTPVDASAVADDPYKDDPVVSPVQVFHQRKPVNSETPSPLISDSWITPEHYWFKRNHHPVPQVSADTYRLTVTGLGMNDLVLSLDDLKSKFKKTTVVSAIQCGGNRRSEMNDVAITAGSPWGACAISNAEWAGVRLRDVLKAAAAGGSGLDEEDLMQKGARHVQFAALEGLEASIPLHKAVDLFGDVILAYEMNGETLPASHGFPIRVVVPGHVGVRNVKWLSKITLSEEEAQGPWQRGMSYKGFSPSLKTIEGIDVERIPSLQEQPVQSAVLVPRQGGTLTPGTQLVQGYAYSGGGRGIVRVDVSVDGGETWRTAKLRAGSEQPLDRSWAWTFWDCEVDIPESAVHSAVQLVCKATDASYNVQPDTVRGIWNLRGINNNAWHRVNVNVVPEDEPEDDI